MTTQACLEAVRTFDAMPLAELNARAELQQRVDRKYIVSSAALQRLLEGLSGTHATLEIDGLRSFTYRSVYYDSPSLDSYRANVQQRRRRFKCRTRHYLDTGIHAFEVKLKGFRGETIKKRCDVMASMALTLPDSCRDFVRECLLEQYGQAVAEPELKAVVGMDYLRTTLVRAEGGERVTIDADLQIDGPSGLIAAMSPSHAIVETKSPWGRGTTDRLLVSLGARPVKCSKYCLAVTLTRSEVRGNDLRRLIGRYFEPAAPDRRDAEERAAILERWPRQRRRPTSKT
jgi:hypothetical protein